MKKIEISEIYDFGELMANIPFYAKDCYDFSVRVEGFVHDVFTVVTLTPSSNPQGWDTARADFETAVKQCYERWDYCVNYGYH